MAAQDVMAAFAQSVSAGPTQITKPAVTTGANPTVPGGGGNGNPAANGDPAAFATNPANPATQTNGSPDKDPLAAFAKLWETSGSNDDNGPIFNTDPKKVTEAFKNHNFIGGIPQEVQDALIAGGPGAVKAMSQIVNAAVRRASANSTTIAQQMIETAVGKVMGRTDKRINDSVRSNLVNNQLRTDNPAFDNPAVKPFIGAIQRQLASQFPDATPAELATKAKEYLSGMASIINPGSSNPSGPGSNNGVNSKTDMDWSGFFDPAG
jgi:hypothetical protein